MLGLLGCLKNNTGTITTYIQYSLLWDQWSCDTLCGVDLACLNFVDHDHDDQTLLRSQL